MSATGEDQNYVDALLVRCGLCDQPPGKACVNSVSGEGPRDQPHGNRVIRGRRANRGES